MTKVENMDRLEVTAIAGAGALGTADLLPLMLGVGGDGLPEAAQVAIRITQLVVLAALLVIRVIRDGRDRGGDE